MSILIDIIPAAARRYVYATYALIGLVLGALQVAGQDVAVALGIYAFVGTALGLTAYANTGAVREDDFPPYVDTPDGE